MNLNSFIDHESLSIGEGGLFSLFLSSSLGNNLPSLLLIIVGGPSDIFHFL